MEKINESSGANLSSIFTDMTYCLFNTVSELARSNDVENLVELGVTQEQANYISMLRPIQIARMKNCINLNIDHDLLIEALDSDVEADDEELKLHVNTAALLLNRLGLISANNDVPTEVKEFDLPPNVIYRLSISSAGDFRRTARTGIKFFTLTANEQNLTMTLEHLIEEMHHEYVIDQLILADASHSMLNALTGIRKRWFTEQRNRHNMPVSAGGPPRKLSFEDEILAYQVWTKSAALPIAERCLEVHKSLGNIALRDSWTSIQKWIDYDNIPERITA